jgi:hypothetical protein
MIRDLSLPEVGELAAAHRATIRRLERRLVELAARPILAGHCHVLRGDLLLARAMLADAERALAGGLPVAQIRAAKPRWGPRAA